MLIRAKGAWSIPENQVTDESSYLAARRGLERAADPAGNGATRRRFLQMAAGAAAVLSLPAFAAGAPKVAPAAPPRWKRNERYALDRPLTEEKIAASHNIFDEFTTDRKGVAAAAKGFVTAPWKVHIGGQVKKQKTVDVEELVRLFGLEERIYRHRCVETWAMAVPWLGFPLKKLVDFAEPLSKARYLRMVSFSSPEKAPGWYASRRVFPYYEALSLPEGTHELAFLATGIYGHSLPVQHGAPIRLVIPWKYGFKSIKSIVAFEFTQNQPGTFWNELSPAQYSFAANVDPSERAPWSQAEETMLGTGETRATLLYNGYNELVAPLYA